MIEPSFILFAVLFTISSPRSSSAEKDCCSRHRIWLYFNESVSADTVLALLDESEKIEASLSGTDLFELRIGSRTMKDRRRSLSRLGLSSAQQAVRMRIPATPSSTMLNGSSLNLAMLRY
jgi:hypothetical protein